MPSLHARRLPRLLLVLVLILAPATVQSSSEAPHIRTVVVRPTVAMPGGDVFVSVRIDPHVDARRLELSIEAPSYFARTDRQLDGADAPRAHDFWWRHLPPGQYKVIARLECAGGVQDTITRSMVVLGAPDEMKEYERPGQSRDATRPSGAGRP